MSAQFDVPRPAPVSGACPLCGLAVAPDAARCAACGYHLAGVDGRPGPLTRAALWWTVAGLVLVYAFTLLIVLAAR
jgi:hypothetical protein